MSTYPNNVRSEEIGTGELDGIWAPRLNQAIRHVSDALGYGTLAISGTSSTQTIPDGADSDRRAMFIRLTGTLSATHTLTLGPDTVKKLWFIENATNGDQVVTIAQGATPAATVDIPNGATKIICCDGAGTSSTVYDVLAELSVDVINAPWDVISSNITVAAGSRNLVDTGSITVTLPANPNDGEQVEISNQASASIAVGRNGENINSTAADETLVAGGATTLVYQDATVGWTEA